MDADTGEITRQDLSEITEEEARALRLQGQTVKVFPDGGVRIKIVTPSLPCNHLWIRPELEKLLRDTLEKRLRQHLSREPSDDGVRSQILPETFRRPRGPLPRFEEYRGRGGRPAYNAALQTYVTTPGDWDDIKPEYRRFYRQGRYPSPRGKGMHEGED